MNKDYLTLFKELARSSSVIAEKVMEKDRKNGEEKHEKIAEKMRDDFLDLHQRLSDTPDKLDKKDFIKLTIGATILLENLKDNRNTLDLTIKGYENDILPKLQQVVACETDEEAIKMAEERFQLIDEK